MKVVNEYEGIFTFGLEENDLEPRECRLRQDGTYLILSGSYMNYYIMCQFPIKQTSITNNLPHIYEDPDDQPECEYKSSYANIVIWTDRSYEVARMEAVVGEDTFQIPIPYYTGRDIQRLGKGLLYNNGIKFY